MELKEKLKILPKVKSFRAKIVKMMGKIEQTKTLTVQVRKRLYVSKYKRYYTKVYKYLVHYDVKDQRSKPIQLGQQVLVHECRRLSARKSKVTYGWV